MPSGKRKRFFATKNDLAPGLSTTVSEECELLFVEGILHDSSDIRVYENLLDFDGLGTSPSGNHNDNHFHGFERGHGPIIEAIPQYSGGTKYAIRHDSHSVDVFLGGIYRDMCIVEGTVSALPPAYDLFVAVARELTRGFKKVGNCVIGPEAYDLAINHGYRLVTVQVESPPEYDLNLE